MTKAFFSDKGFRLNSRSTKWLSNVTLLSEPIAEAITKAVCKPSVETVSAVTIQTVYEAIAEAVSDPAGATVSELVVEVVSESHSERIFEAVIAKYIEWFSEAPCAIVTKSVSETLVEAVLGSDSEARVVGRAGPGSEESFKRRPEVPGVLRRAKRSWCRSRFQLARNSRRRRPPTYSTKMWVLGLLRM
jgi:hypothetical protein